MNFIERAVLACKVLAGEHTSAPIASIAARGINRPHLLTYMEIRAVCASALTQARDRKKPDDKA